MFDKGYVISHASLAYSTLMCPSSPSDDVALGQSSPNISPRMSWVALSCCQRGSSVQPEEPAPACLPLLCTPCRHGAATLSRIHGARGRGGLPVPSEAPGQRALGTFAGQCTWRNVDRMHEQCEAGPRQRKLLGCAIAACARGFERVRFRRLRGACSSDSRSPVARGCQAHRMRVVRAAPDSPRARDTDRIESCPAFGRARSLPSEAPARDLL